MVGPHLEDGEEENLTNFLATDDEMLYMVCESIGPIKWNILKGTIMEDRVAYQSRSAYGNTREEIIVNATDHLQGCPDCLEKYRKAVHKTAYDCADIEAEESGMMNENFTERFHQHIRRIDKLGLVQKLD